MHSFLIADLQTFSTFVSAFDNYLVIRKQLTLLTSIDCRDVLETGITSATISELLSPVKAQIKRTHCACTT